MMRQFLRITGAVLISAGVLGLAWAVLIWQWQDPVTALYTTYEQNRLTASYDHVFATYQAPAAPRVRRTVDLRAEPRISSRRRSATAGRSASGGRSGDSASHGSTCPSTW
jgi:hypothetical protein